MQLLLVLREQMMSCRPFLSCLPLVLNVPRSPSTGGRVCVCMCMCVCVFVDPCLFLHAPSGSVHGFAWNFITPSPCANPQIHTLEQLLCRVKPFVVSVSGYRFADKWSNVSMASVSVVGPFKSSSPLQTGTAAVVASEPLLTTGWGLQQTSVVGCVRTGQITCCCQASWW